MAKPQPTDAHLRIAHSILEQIMVSDFSKRQLAILLYILRLSWGCGKTFAIIPRQKDFEMVGVGEGHIKQELTVLVRDGIITIDDNKYSFNKDYDVWHISRARAYNQQILTDMVRLNLNGTYRNGKAKDGELTETVSGNLPKGEEPTYQKGKNTTPELASPKEKVIFNINNIYTYLLEVWNSQSIIIHKKLTTDMKSAIDSAKQDYTQEEIEQAIINYAIIVKGSEFYFNHKWTLAEFISRRKGNNIERFLDLEVAKSNFRIKNYGTHQQSPRGTKLPETYTEPPYDPELADEIEADRKRLSQS